MQLGVPLILSMGFNVQRSRKTLYCVQWFYPILQKLVVRRHPYTHAHCLNFEIALRFGKNFREVSFEELASDCSSSMPLTFSGEIFEAQSRACARMHIQHFARLSKTTVRVPASAGPTARTAHKICARRYA